MVFSRVTTNESGRQPCRPCVLSSSVTRTWSAHHQDVYTSVRHCSTGSLPWARQHSITLNCCRLLVTAVRTRAGTDTPSCVIPLELLPSKTRVAVLPGNHDHPQRLRAALARRAEIAPEAVRLGDWTVLILDSHWCSHEGGQIGKGQLRWLETQLQERNLTSGPLLVCLHHPPLPIGAPEWDRIGLDDGEQLMRLLQPLPQLRAVVFGHLHQHWQGSMPERNDVVLLACPSTLCAFPALQACPLGRSQLPGGRLLDLSRNGRLTHTLLRWPMPKRRLNPFGQSA